MSELHDDIMRIPVPKHIGYDLLANKVEAYKIGHRDARHAAAELAAAEGIEQLKAELECARGDLKTAMEIAKRNQKSAERYEWIHNNQLEALEIMERFVGEQMQYSTEEELDTAIDAEITRERT